MKYSEIPPLVTVAKTKNLYHYTVNVLIEQEDEAQEVEEYDVESATLTIDHQLGDDDYGPLTSAIIRERYSADEVEAISLNYTDSKTAANKAEMKALQEWRKVAKSKAREAIDYVAGLSGE